MANLANRAVCLFSAVNENVFLLEVQTRLAPTFGIIRAGNEIDDKFESRSINDRLLWADAWRPSHLILINCCCPPASLVSSLPDRWLSSTHTCRREPRREKPTHTLFVRAPAPRESRWRRFHFCRCAGKRGAVKRNASTTARKKRTSAR